jgi:protein TonB
VTLRRALQLLPALVLALLLNLALLGGAGHLSRARPVVRDYGEPLPVTLVTVRPEQAPPPERAREDPPPPEPRPRPQPQIVPELGRAKPGEPPAITVQLDLDPRLFTGELPRGNTVFEASALDEPPAVIYRADPPYPMRAQQRGIAGDVRVRLLVRADGSIGEVTILEATPAGMFEETVLETVPTWKFSPGVIDGRPVDSWVVTTVHFEVSR